MVVAGGPREASVAFVKAIITQKYVAWLSVCNSKSMMNFKSVRRTDKYSDVQAYSRLKWEAYKKYFL
jgi:hypothetical protein